MIPDVAFDRMRFFTAFIITSGVMGRYFSVLSWEKLSAFDLVSGMMETC